MPYSIQRRKNKWVVINTDTGDVKGTHDTKEKAEAQMRALYVHVPEARKTLSSHIGWVSIVKRDDTQHVIEGYASSENMDQQPGEWQGQYYEGDVVQAEAIEEALPAYMEWANLREMHTESAVGTVLKAEVIHGDVILPDGRRVYNPLHVIAKIVDPDAWDKVITGVYKGFSIQADVYKLKLAKVAGHVVRLIQSLRLIEISLVDRPANPGAKIILWKGATMAKKQLNIQKAADPKKAIQSLQELRDACELDGDLEAATNYSNAIALVAQGMGADVAVVAEPEEEAEGEHDALGKESPTEDEMDDEAEAGDDVAPSEAEKEQALDDLNSEQPEEDQAQPEAENAEDENKEAAEDDTDSLPKEEKVAKKSARHAIKKAAHAPVESISKAEFVSLQEKLDTTTKALAGDIARLVKSIEDLSDQVDALKDRPVLREVPLSGMGDQPLQILKSMRDETTDPALREKLGHQIAELEIRGAQPNFVGFNR
jgi:hypothetical protein